MIRAYGDPKLYGVDFTQPSQIIDKARDEVGQSILMMQEKRQKAMEKLETDYSAYMEKTYLERGAAFDQQTNDAIRDSVKVNLAQFSNMTPSEKAKNLENVARIKTMNANIESIMTMVKNPDISLDLSGNPDYAVFASDLAALKNFTVEKNPEGIGFVLVHEPVDENGNKTGDREIYNDDKIANVAASIRDVSPILDAVEEVFDKSTASVQARIDDYARNGRRPSEEELESWVQTVIDANDLRLSEQEKSTYYTNVVNRGADYVPINIISKDGKSRPSTDKEKRLARNISQSQFREYTKKYILDHLKDKLPKIEKPTSSELKGIPQDTDIRQVSRFESAYENMVSNKDTKFMDVFFNPLGFGLEFEDGGNSLYVYDLEAEESDITGTDIRSGVSMRDIQDSDYEEDQSIKTNKFDRSGKKKEESKEKRKLIAKIDMSSNTSKEEFFNSFRNSVMNKKEAVTSNYRWVNFFDRLIDYSNQPIQEYKSNTSNNTGGAY